VDTGNRQQTDLTHKTPLNPYERQRLSDAWAYVFHRRVLGELGRMLLQGPSHLEGRCGGAARQISPQWYWCSLIEKYAQGS
jgi:hypothetical protein